ncbi:arf-GAP with Rho-GAP domain, ANK repeat and PH domain-containing protein 1 isoform X1 [Anguilla rostrata]|uniref:arf-GAP with Rho-GAP domain, ANK repeat and PH domain-containing protein 1 isoform X1 n=1 Tax=Anguilla rostrata TaxID=7938 RepID=UPI0030D0920B
MTAPIPKPRARYRLEAGVQKQLSSDRHLLNDSLDAKTAGIVPQDYLQEKNNPVATGGPCAYGIDSQENGDKPTVLKGPPKVQSTSPTLQTRKAMCFTDSADGKPLSDTLLHPPPWQNQSQEDSTHSQQNCGLIPSAPPEDSGTGGEAAGDSSQNHFVWPATPPASPTGHQELAEWATEPGYDTNDDECLTPGTPKSEDEATVRTETRQSPKELQAQSLTVGSSQVSSGQASVTSTGQPPQPENGPIILTKRVKQKAPRAATIRVSRKKRGRAESGVGTRPGEGSLREGAVSRSSWLDVWQGRRHHVLWATLDGQLMSLWKKRTDKFTEMAFHVSSISSVRPQERARFSIYFGKKHIDFMAHSAAVQEGWVSSLLASRGQEPPPPPEQHGPLVMKDPRTKVYAAILGHNLWIYRNKEDYGLGLGMTYVSMSVASVKQTGRHGFSLITPYRTFSFSADSSRELAVWQGCLTQVIRSALSCSEVALRMWASPWNKVCADCGSASPEWASVNLLVVICEACAGQHRSLGINVSKVRSLKMDSKVWTEPLIQLFVLYGNKVANEIWGHNVPAAEQILPDATPNERNAFMKAKYCKGLYRRAHPLASSQKLLNQRLCEVVCGGDIPETMSLLCSGARVLCHSGDPQCPSPIALAERAGQAMQTELLRHNEYAEVPAYCPKKPSRETLSSTTVPDSTSTAGSQEELHGKLEEDRFLFSEENDSAACDVLDLREVISILDLSTGETHEFEMLTLTDQLVCQADTREALLAHLTHILKVVLPGPVSDEELEGVFTVSRVAMREGGDLQHTEVWVALKDNEILIYPTGGRQKDKLPLTPDTAFNLDLPENTVQLITAERTVSMQFERDEPCRSWAMGLKRRLPGPALQVSRQDSLYPSMPPVVSGKVPPAVERCISHITQYGLKVDGIYRRCGMATKIGQLVAALSRSPGAAELEADEMGVLDTAGALKQILRQQVVLIPGTHMGSWVEAAACSDETKRLRMFRRSLNGLPPDNRATLNALCEHLYLVQLYSGENRMTAQNLALVFVPTLFQDLAMNTNMVRLTRELIIHYTLIFQGEGAHAEAGHEELVTVF